MHKVSLLIVNLSLLASTPALAAEKDLADLFYSLNEIERPSSEAKALDCYLLLKPKYRHRSYKYNHVAAVQSELEELLAPEPVPEEAGIVWYLVADNYGRRANETLIDVLWNRSSENGRAVIREAVADVYARYDLEKLKADPQSFVDDYARGRFVYAFKWREHDDLFEILKDPIEPMKRLKQGDSSTLIKLIQEFEAFALETKVQVDDPRDLAIKWFYACHARYRLKNDYFEYRDDVVINKFEHSVYRLWWGEPVAWSSSEQFEFALRTVENMHQDEIEKLRAIVEAVEVAAGL